MSAIDAHTHAFPDELAPRAIAALEDDCPWQALGAGTIGSLIDSMDAAGIDISTVCTIATKPEQAESIFQWCKDIRGERIEPFPSVHPDTPDAAGWIERFAGAVFVGIKLHPMYQSFAADDPRLDPIYSAAIEWGLVVTLHSGCDIAFPPHDDRASPVRLRRVIDRFPNLKLLCTHVGGWRSWDDVERHLIGTNCFIETSFSLDELGRERAVKMIRRHGVERVLFGTDWPWRSQKKEIALVKDLGLSQEETEAILWRNAAKLLRREIVARPPRRG